MKITGTRSYILVQFDHRTVKITGELTKAPAFYANYDSIKSWEPPYDNVKITDQEKKCIVEKIMQKRNVDFKIFFED